MMDKIVFDCIALAIILSISLVGVAVPLYFRGSVWNERVIEFMSFFTGGVFLGAGMIHLLPDAVEDFDSADLPEGIARTLCMPFTSFCLGWLLVWTIEANQPDQHKHAVLAVAQAARTSRTTADICFVTVPPVTTYGKGKESARATDQRLTDAWRPRSHGLERMQPLLPREDEFRHHEHHGVARGLNLDECQPCGTLEQSVRVQNDQHAEVRDVQPMLESSLKRKWCTGSDCTSTLSEHVHSGVRHKHVLVDAEQSAVLPMLLALLFSAHSLIAGVALGIKPKLDSSAIAILVAILGHKFVEAVSLASNFVKENVSLRTASWVLLIYTMMTPMGIVLGAGLNEVFRGPSVRTSEAFVGGFAAGSFVFLASHEMSHSSTASSLSCSSQASVALFGMLLMAFLSMWA